MLVCELVELNRTENLLKLEYLFFLLTFLNPIYDTRVIITKTSFIIVYKKKL